MKFPVTLKERDFSDEKCLKTTRKLYKLATEGNGERTENETTTGRDERVMT